LKASALHARPVAHAFVVSLVFLAATAFYTYPLIRRPWDTLLVGLGDYPTEISMVTWNGLQVFRDPGRLFQVPFYYPYSNGVAYQQSAFFTGLLAAPFLAAGAGPVLAANLILIAELAASGALTYLLAYTITGRSLPSLIAGVIFAFHPNRMDHIGQFTYQQAVLFPLIVWAAYNFVLEGRGWHLCVATMALWAQFLSSLYNAYALVMMLAGLTVALLILRPDRLTWSLTARVAGATLVLGLALAPFAGPYLAVHREMGFRRTLDQANWFGMDLLSILDPGEFNRFYHRRLLSLGRAEGGLFPGFITLALAAAALALYLRGPDRPPLPSWARRLRWLLAGLTVVALGTIALVPVFGKVRLMAGALKVLTISDLTLAVNAIPGLALAWLALEGRRGQRGPLAPREWMLVLLFLTLLTYLLCLAPTLLVGGQVWGRTLFRWVYLYLPGGAAFRAPGRWSLVFVLPLALLAALGARAVAERLPWRWRQVVPALLLGGLVAELTLTPIPWQRLPPTPAVYEWLRDEPGDFAILQLPIYERASDAWAMLWAIGHGKRVVNGHGGFALPTWEELVSAADSRDPEQLATAIRTIYPVRYVVVHPELGLGRTWQPMWDVMRAGHVPALSRVRTFGLDEVYAVAGTPETGVEVRRHFSSDLVRSRRRATYSLLLDREDPEVERLMEVRFNGRLVATHQDAAREHGTLTLTPPFPGADRNELAFRHVYRVTPGVATSGPYRIGRTARQSPVDLSVRSAGHAHGKHVSIRLNGHELIRKGRRGYSVAALDPTDGRVLGLEVFDTHQSGGDSDRMAAFVERWPAGTIVVAAVMDEAGWHLTERAVRALQSVGGRVDLRGTFGLSHLLVGVRGANPGEALEEWGPRPLRVIIGKDRPLGVTLEAFDLGQA
jgi:Interleukin-like EMT inducer